MIQNSIRGRAVAAGLALLLAASALADDKWDITGGYECRGINPGGQTYRGTVQITKKGDTYHLRWAIGQNDNYQGIGILEGDVLAVGYYGGITGVVVYRIEKGPKLVGRWAILDGKGHTYTETLTK